MKRLALIELKCMNNELDHIFNNHIFNIDHIVAILDGHDGAMVVTVDGGKFKTCLTRNDVLTKINDSIIEHNTAHALAKQMGVV